MFIYEALKKFEWWVNRPARALIIAYGYVLRGEKVTTPMKWSDI